MALIQYLSRIQFDYGAVALLSSELERLGLRRPLVVTDRGIVDAGLLGRVLAAAHPVSPVLYDETTENPNEGSLDTCLDLWRTHECDGLIALGGGSAIDLSKAVALLASHGGRISDYAISTGGSEKIRRVAPQIAIPTAAGTGAEVGRACVMTLHSGRKSVAVNLNMVADTVICDPELTLSLPARLTAATGLDALSHGIEAFCASTINPPADAIALDCIARVGKWLPIVVRNGQDREARWHMMMAALQGGMVLQKGLGAAHAMANPLGEGGYHHGTLIGMLLPHALEFNASCIPDKIARVAALLGATDSAASHLRGLLSDFDLPDRLSDLGIERDQLEPMSRRAAADHLSTTNPRRAASGDYLEMLILAF